MPAGRSPRALRDETSFTRPSATLTTRSETLDAFIAWMFANNFAHTLREALDRRQASGSRSSSRLSEHSTVSLPSSVQSEPTPTSSQRAPLALSLQRLRMSTRPNSARSFFRRSRQATPASSEVPPPEYTETDPALDTPFQPTPAMLAQSRRNFLESSAMRAAAASANESPSISAQQRRQHQQQLLTGRSTVDTPDYAAERREHRRGGKFLYAAQDTTILAGIDEEIARLRQGCSPNALAVSSRVDGLVSTVEEFHGFVHQTPLVIRISTVPVLEAPIILPGASDLTVSKAKRTRSVKEQWSAFVIESKGNFVGMPPLPLNRLLRIKQPDLFTNADSGDLLLEGSFCKARSLYVQDIGGSLSSSVGVLYRDPVTGCLFVLTSRIWSKRYHQEKHASKDTLDLASRDYAQLSCVDGVTMHPLDAWVSQARARGSYFLLRKLTKGKRPPTSLQRQRVGQRLMAWFLAHGGTLAPTASEQRLRLKGAAKIDARLAEMLGTDTADAQDASLPARSLGHVTRLCGFAERDKYADLLQQAEAGKGSMSCSQVVLGALEHADIFDLGAATDPEAAQARRVLSSSNLFEMRRLPFRAPRGSSGFGGWGYEMLTLVTGDKQAVSTHGRVTSVSHLGRVEMSVYGQPLNLEEGAV